MGLRTNFVKTFFKAQGDMADVLANTSETMQKTLATVLGRDKRLQNSDHLMHILMAANHMLKLPLVSKNAKRSRKLFEQRMHAIKGKPLPLREIKDIKMHTAHGAMAGRYYVPHSAESNAEQGVILFFHGGGFVVGSINTHDECCQYLCQYAQLPVLSIGYRLAPEHPAPAAVEDCLNALKWLHDHAAELGVNAQKIYVAGDSAGGNLAAVVSQQTKHSPHRPAAQLLIYPVTDSQKQYSSYREYGKGLTLTMEDKHNIDYFYIHKGSLKPENPKIAPMKGSVSHVAPAYVVTSEYDLLLDEGEAYAHKLRQAGIKTYSERMYGLPHGFVNMINLHPECKLATIKLARGFRSFVDGL